MKYRYRSEEEMKDSGVEWIGKIPKEWNVTRSKSLWKKEKRDVKDGYGVVTAFRDGEVTLRENRRTEGFTFAIKEIGYQGVLKGDLVISAMDAFAGAMGISDSEGKCSPVYSVCSPIKKLVPQYYKYLLKEMSQKGYILSLAKGIRERSTDFRYAEFANTYLLYPNILQQSKIANFLDEKTTQFDSIISKKEALIQKLEEAKKSLISEVVTGKVKVVKTSDGYELVERKREEMKDSGVEWLGEVPREWEVKRLRFLGNLQNGISKSGEEFGYGYPFVSYGDVYKNISLPKSVDGLVNSSLNDRKIYSVLEGDVFFTRTSETVEEIGIASTCLETIPDATFAGFLIRFRPIKGKLYKGFSKYYFRCDLNRKFFVKEMNLVTRASLSQNLLNNLSIVLPSHEEQMEIYLALEFKIGGIDCSINKLKHQIEKLKQAKQSLISEAVTGKIEILD